MVDSGGGNCVFYFSRTQESAFLDTFSKNFVFVPQMPFYLAEKWRGHGPPAPPPAAQDLCYVPLYSALIFFYKKPTLTVSTPVS